MFGRRLLNHGEVVRAYERIGKRKGKVVSLCDLSEGDIVRIEPTRPTVYSMLQVGKAEGGTFTAWRVWDRLFSPVFCTTLLSRESLKGVCIRRVATKADCPDARYEPELKTLVYFNRDGTVCCQNVVHGQMGQHWTESRAKYESRKEKESGDREWLETGEVCDCSLVRSQSERRSAG